MVLHYKGRHVIFSVMVYEYIYSKLFESLSYFIVLCIRFSAHMNSIYLHSVLYVTVQRTYWVAVLRLYVMSENKMPLGVNGI